jgi:AcrR family transcriptional regulator
MRAKEILSKKIPRVAYHSKTARRKKKIIQVATQLFSEKGYHDVTIDEVATKAGIAKGTIYLYFESKERLYLEILENCFESIESRIEKEVSKTDPASEKLRKVLRLIFGFYRQNLDVLRILSRDETHLIREHYQFTERWRERRVRLYEKILEKGVKEGFFRPMNTRLVALIVFGLVRSVMFFYKTDKSAEEMAEEVLSVIKSGILDPAQKEFYGDKSGE